MVIAVSYLAAGAFLGCGSHVRGFDGSSGAGASGLGASGSPGSSGEAGRAEIAGSGGGSPHAGGSGQAGGAGACKPGETDPCFESPAGKSYGALPAQALGSCKIGVRICSTEAVWGACVGAVPPEAADTCEPGNDADCDGKANEGCSCTNGEKRECGSDVGECAKGTQTCANAIWGDCVGEVKPASVDTCDAGNDANCNGSANNGCACINGTTQDCGSATGNCKKGAQTCTNGVWGTCTGGVTAAAKDLCSPAGDDANCNGVPNEGCDCTVGQTRPCAKCGTQTCDATGKWSATCAGSKECEVGDVKTDSIACGNCGTQSRKATCSAQCTYGAFTNVGSCLGSGPCAPGVTADQSQNVSCGNCGTQKQTRACTAACDWPATWTNSGACTGSGCVPGSTQAATPDPCGYCGEQAKQQVCSQSCQFGGVVNNGACMQKECNTMPGDERVGFVTCFWPDPNFHTVCLPSQKCCATTQGGYSCQTACGATDHVAACDGPEDCGGSTCCTQFYDLNENSYSYCTTSCQYSIKCHADTDCPATFHCSKYSSTADYKNGICYGQGGPP